MVTMTIQFNEASLEEKGLTTEKLLEKFDDYCKKRQVLRPQNNVFKKDGVSALAVIGNIMDEIMKSDFYLNLIESWYWDVDGEYENLLEGALKRRNAR